MSCREESIHPVTFEIAETKHEGRREFQPRVRLDGIVIRNIGEPQATEVEALGVVAEGLDSNVCA